MGPDSESGTIELGLGGRSSRIETLPPDPLFTILFRLVCDNRVCPARRMIAIKSEGRSAIVSTTPFLVRA